MRIDIYMDTDTHGLYRRDRGETWYLMESDVKGKKYLKIDRITWLELNRNGAALEGIVYALHQIRAKDSEIFIHIEKTCSPIPFKIESVTWSRYIIGTTRARVEI